MSTRLSALRYNRTSDSVWRFRGYLMLGPHFFHRVIYTMAHGFIPDGWVVHHLDHNRLNNEITNLIALPESVHDAVHSYDWVLDRADCTILLKLFSNLPIRDSEEVRDGPNKS